MMLCVPSALVTIVRHPAIAPSSVADSVCVRAAYVTVPGGAGWPSTSAWTWMATLAVEVSFLLFLLETLVCVKSPASREALMSSSLLAGVLTGAESIVTHPLVDDVCCTRVRSDVENANCAAERAWLVWTASGSASITSSIRRHIVLKTFIAQLLSVEDEIGRASCRE